MIVDRVDEEFLLFSLHRNGRWDRTGGSVKYGVAGAWLAELLMQGRIRLDGVTVVPKGRYPHHDPALEAAFQPIRESPRNRKLSYWVRFLARNSKPGIALVMKRLQERGYVDRVPARKWGRRIWLYPQHTPGGRKQMRQYLVDNLFGAREPDEATLALLAVLDAAGMSAHVFGAAHEREAHERVRRLAARDIRFAHLADAVWGVQGLRFFLLDA